VSLTTTKQGSHRWCFDAVTHPAVGLSPEEGNGVVGRVVFEHEWKRAPPIAQRQMENAADVGVPRAYLRIVVGLRQFEEVVKAPRDGVNP
jgi:hypothetical protein